MKSFNEWRKLHESEVPMDEEGQLQWLKNNLTVRDLVNSSGYFDNPEFDIRSASISNIEIDRSPIRSRQEPYVATVSYRAKDNGNLYTVTFGLRIDNGIVKASVWAD